MPMNPAAFLVTFAYMLAVTIFVGKIITFSFLVAPLIHQELEKQEAAKFLRRFFPRYYKVGIGCAIVALLTAMPIAYFSALHHVYLWSIVWTLILFVEVICLKIIFPILDSTREARANGNPEATKKWELAHKTSVRLNLLNLLAGLALIVGYLI